MSYLIKGRGWARWPLRALSLHSVVIVSPPVAGELRQSGM